MKQVNLIIIVLFLFITSEKLFAQCDVESLLSKLNSTNRGDVWQALDSIVLCDVTEAIPDLEDKLDSEQGITMKYYILNALYQLNSANIQTSAVSFINSVDELNVNEEIKLSNKLSAVKILFELGNYSNAQLVFDIADNYNLSFTSELIDLLGIISQNVPAMEVGAKNRLVSQSLNAYYGWDRYRALNILVDNYGSEFIDLVLDRSENDPDMSVRMESIRYLVSLNYDSLNQFLKQRIYNEGDPSIRVIIADYTLTLFGKPWDLKSVIEYLPEETDTVSFSVIEYDIDNFIPPVPDSTVSPYQMATNLLVYNDSLYSYGWTTTQTAYNNHKTKINSIKAGLARDPVPPSVLTTINSELAAVESEYSSGILTTEAYVFLKYHLQYIKDRIT